MTVEVNGEATEVRPLAAVIAAGGPEVGEAVVAKLALIAQAADASIDLVALGLGRPRAWVANNVTSEEAGRVLAEMAKGAPDGG